ncbi:hypothetical protein D3C75_1152630 [compost metagenome]
MPVSMVSYSAADVCSWNSSTIAQLGDWPSPGSPISGSNLLSSPITDRFFAATWMPKASTSSGVRRTICRAGRNTSQACRSVVAPQYTSAPNSPSITSMYRPTPAASTLLPFLRGTSI